MSNAVSALNGARAEGFATVTEAGLCGMITLRGELSDAGLQKAVKAAGVAMPKQGQVVTGGERTLCWMSPDELLLLCPYAEVAEVIAGLSKALAGSHHLIANVSDARALFSVVGGDAREVIAKLSPADLSPDAFGPGQLRRTRLAQVPAAFWMADETTVNVICFRSVARYVFDILRTSATQGCEVGYF